MASEDGYAKLDTGSNTLTPLPDVYRVGLVAVGSAAMVSFIAAGALTLFLTYKLLVWTPTRQQKQTKESEHMEIDLNLGLSGRHYPPRKFSGQPSDMNVSTPTSQAPLELEECRNPFPLLIYNILLAECQTSLGYTLNLSWAVRNGIYVGTPTCWAQGWLNNIGVLASSILFVTMSINTYLSVVWGWTPSRKTTILWIISDWTAALILNSAGIMQTRNGRAQGGWFVRANTWCWINAKYDQARLWGEWAWILASIPLTLLLYSLVFWTLYREKRALRHLLRRSSSESREQPQTQPQRGGRRQQQQLETSRPKQSSGHHPAFLVYPFVYIACTSPLAVARLMTIRGSAPGAATYFAAGLVLATNGLWNTILWSTTMLFSSPEDIRDTGLDPFVFMRTPPWRRYGNMVWIQGRPNINSSSTTRRKISSSSSGGGGGGAGDGGAEPGPEWWWWQQGGQTGWKKKKRSGRPRGGSQESLNGEEQVILDNHIHMNIITTVVVEDAGDGMRDTLESSGAYSIDKEIEQTPRSSKVG